MGWINYLWLNWCRILVVGQHSFTPRSVGSRTGVTRVINGCPGTEVRING